MVPDCSVNFFPSSFKNLYYPETCRIVNGIIPLTILITAHGQSLRGRRRSSASGGRQKMENPDYDWDYDSARHLHTIAIAIITVRRRIPSVILLQTTPVTWPS